MNEMNHILVRATIRTVPNIMKQSGSATEISMMEFFSLYAYCDTDRANVTFKQVKRHPSIHHVKPLGRVRPDNIMSTRNDDDNCLKC